MIQIQAPKEFWQTLDSNPSFPSVFLAGSIEMGAAENWRTETINQLKSLDVVVLNPRRDDWDSSWRQERSFSPFREQVEWELAAQEQADIIAMYLDPATKSPISLLELGLFARTGKLLICCPPKFWLSGNVDIVCSKYNITKYNVKDYWLVALREKIRNFRRE